jgi:hypothetical protein
MIAFAERHEFEQYFFAERTLDDLCELLGRFQRPVILCAPRLGEAMERRGRTVATLDVDERFARLRGFVKWNIRRPAPLGFKPDLILCDPPFFGVSLGELFLSIRLLARFDTTTPVAVSYLSRRAAAITAALRPFGVEATAYRPAYVSVENAGRTEIELFANFADPLWNHRAVRSCG